jgi:hypothetical protein
MTGPSIATPPRARFKKNSGERMTHILSFKFCFGGQPKTGGNCQGPNMLWANSKDKYFPQKIAKTKSS